MPMPPDKWQERLERHFESLARTRADSGFPIFAFEHGLGDQELEEISGQLRSRLTSNLPLSPHWLLWVVYATERGYSYAGDEYWRSFEEHTPGWDFADRYKVAPWFVKFQKAYNGVVPDGPWAKQFKIIAWPITHAILPRYLQRQFARALYDLRFSLAGLDTIKPASIGRLLAANTHHASTRFQQFLQQEELTGRIVLALLGQTPAGGKEPIYPPTLRRIVRDLEKVRNAREWLKEAQHVVTDRFTGIGRGSGPPAPRQPTIRDGRITGDISNLGIRPELFLRYSGAGTWSVVMHVPSFRNVAALNTDIQAFLKRARCRLNGGQDVKPAGWLLSGNGKGILKSWPEAHKPLVQFEHSNGAVDHLLESECRLSSGPPWLYRIGRDGTAREIIGRIVRPGGEYILLTTAALPAPHPCMNLCSVDCTGVQSFRVRVPKEVSAQDTSWLQGLGVQVARTIRVWPAGLPGRGWDGEGNAEWLMTEAPCFGIVHDHPVDSYALRFDSGPETVVEAGRVGDPVFVRLPPLPAGSHTLTVKARRHASLASVAPSPPAEGFVHLKVREPEPWIPGVPSHPGLIVTLDPHDANLDTFWKNDVHLSVMGPESHFVTFTVSLEGSDGQEILSEQIGGPMDLPVTPEAWSKRFAQFVTKRMDFQWSYLEAATGRLIIKGETLGEYAFRFEHDVLPLRWVLRSDHDKVIARLIDDTGEEGSEPTILFLGMDHPARTESRPAAEALSGVTVRPPGGLFIANHGNHSDAIVISAGLSGTGFQGLGVNPVVRELQDGTVTLAQSLHLLELWHDARLAGFLSDIRREQITDTFLADIYERLCGSDWERAEAAFRTNPISRAAIDALQRSVDRHTGFAAVLRRDYTKMDGNPNYASNWYADLAARYGLCKDQNLCTFALRLASQPHRLSGICGTRLGALLNEVSNNPAILRGARFLALLSANQNVSGRAALLPRWKW